MTIQYFKKYSPGRGLINFMKIKKSNRVYYTQVCAYAKDLNNS